MALTMQETGSNVTYHIDGTTLLVEFDLASKRATIKNQDGTIIMSNATKHDILSFYTIFTQINTDANTKL